MAGIWQLTKVFRRKRKFHKNRRKDLNHCPQKMARLVEKNATRELTPRKPNSAKRKIVRIRVKLTRYTFKKTFAYLPGQGLEKLGSKYQNLAPFDEIFIRGGRTPDLPGLKYKVIHGFQKAKKQREKPLLQDYKKFFAEKGPIPNSTYRGKKRSKYGVKNPRKQAKVAFRKERAKWAWEGQWNFRTYYKN